MERSRSIRRIVRKRQCRLDGIVLSLTTRGLTTREASAHFAEAYGTRVLKDTFSTIAGKVIGKMTVQGNRPLDRVYTVVFIDVIVAKVCDGQEVTNRPFHVAVGVATSGEGDIPGSWAGDGGKGAKYWIGILTETKNRGVEDVCIVACDGLKGLPESITTTLEFGTVRTCIIHLIRNVLEVTSRTCWGQISRDLKPLFAAPNKAAAKGRLDEFTEKRDDRYPAIRGTLERS